jgi:ssDNA-binding Zn-finger/Zn-ribbon topoisomerase 1
MARKLAISKKKPGMEHDIKVVKCPVCGEFVLSARPRFTQTWTMRCGRITTRPFTTHCGEASRR